MNDNFMTSYHGADLDAIAVLTPYHPLSHGPCFCGGAHSSILSASAIQLLLDGAAMLRVYIVRCNSERVTALSKLLAAADVLTAAIAAPCHSAHAPQLYAREAVQVCTAAKVAEWKDSRAHATRTHRRKLMLAATCRHDHRSQLWWVCTLMGRRARTQPHTRCSCTTAATTPAFIPCQSSCQPAFCTASTGVRHIAAQGYTSPVLDDPVRCGHSSLRRLGRAPIEKSRTRLRAYLLELHCNEIQRYGRLIHS